MIREKEMKREGNWPIGFMGEGNDHLNLKKGLHDQGSYSVKPIMSNESVMFSIHGKKERNLWSPS